MTATVTDLHPAPESAAPSGVRDSFITAITPIARSLHLGPSWCAVQAQRQPQNREAWERLASALELRDAGTVT